MDDPLRNCPQDYGGVFTGIPTNKLNADKKSFQIENICRGMLGRWHRDGIAQDITLYIYKFQTLLNSDQLAALCQLPTKEFPGYYIDEYVEFDVSNRTKDVLREPIQIGDICVAGRKSNQAVNNVYYIQKNPGISLQTHIDYLLSTFKAAFDLYPPMPYILEKVRSTLTGAGILWRISIAMG